MSLKQVEKLINKKKLKIATKDGEVPVISIYKDDEGTIWLDVSEEGTRTIWLSKGERLYL